MILTRLWSFRYVALISVMSIPLVLLLILFRDLIKSLVRFRRVYDHCPIPLNPAYGVVVAAVEVFNVDSCAPYNVNTTNDAEDGNVNGNGNVEITDAYEWCMSINDEIKPSTSNKNGIHFSHAFKSYRNNSTAHRKALNLALQQVPLRILIFGDSIARGVGVAKSCTPVLPESVAAELSQKLGGRPVFWTVLAEPGASTNWLAKQVENQRSSAACNKYSVDEAVQLENMFASPTDGNDDDSTTASVKEMDDKEKWVRLLQHHKKLHTITPFSKYDVVMIINGINDVKRVILPHMTFDDTDKNESCKINDKSNDLNNGSNPKQTIFQSNFQRILDSLDFRSMHNHVHDISCSSSSNCIQESSLNRCHSLIRQGGQPVVVMPSLPVRLLPTEVFGTAMSHAICIYLADLMAQQKITVAEQYHPADILIIKEPPADILIIKEPTAHYSSICNDRNILLNLVAVNSNKCEEVKRQMKNFYSVLPKYKNFAPDLVHPNDNGYKSLGHYFGKNIATHLQTMERKKTE